MNDKEYSCIAEKPVVAKAGVRTVVYIDYKLKMKDFAYEGRAWGVTKKSKHDKYDYYFGLALAKIRAKAKLAKTVEEKLVHFSKMFCGSPPAFENWGYQPRHMTATEAMMKEREQLFYSSWPDSIIKDQEEINKYRNKITSERMDAKRKKADTYTYDVGEPITKMEHLKDYLVVSTKTRVILFTMENDVLTKKGEIKI